jgi:hypothetical protein
MIELLRIHALVRLARILVFISKVADRFGRTCRRAAGSILDELTAWMDARDAQRQARPER